MSKFFFMCWKNVFTQATPLSILWIPYMVDNLNNWVPKGILESDSVKIWQSCPRWILTKRKKNEKKAPTFQVLQNLGMTSLLTKLVPRKARKNRICFGSLQGRAIHTSLAIQYNTWLWVLKNSAAFKDKARSVLCLFSWVTNTVYSFTSFYFYCHHLGLLTRDGCGCSDFLSVKSKFRGSGFKFWLRIWKHHSLYRGVNWK